MNLTELSYLVVDDDSDSRDVITVLLEHVIGSNCVNTWETNNTFQKDLSRLSYVPDVFMLDLVMAPHTGYDMLKILRRDPVYAQSIMVAITARVMTHDIEHMKEAGFDGLISKPIVRKVFPAILNRIVAGEKIWYVA